AKRIGRAQRSPGQEYGHGDGQTKRLGCDCRLACQRQGRPCHRPALSPARDCRSHPLSRNQARARQSDHRRQSRAPSRSGGQPMRAAVCTQDGAPDVLHLQEVEKPTPKANAILVRLLASTVTPPDCAFRQADPFIIRLMNGLTRPKNGILGGLLTGEVEAVGPDVTAFKPGDLVFGSTGPQFGAHAEYVILPAEGVVAPKPANMTHEEAAGLPEALTPLYFLSELAHLQPGQTILINGASGSVGTYGVQLAKHLGAEVTAVCSTKNVELVKSLGAD